MRWLLLILLFVAACGPEDEASNDMEAAAPTATAPGVTATEQPSSDAAADVVLAIIEPENGAVVTTKEVVLRGLAPPGAEVRLDVERFFDARWEADAAGNWEHPVELEEGENHFEVFLDGNDEVRASVTVIYEPLPASTQPPAQTAATEDQAGRCEDPSQALMAEIQAGIADSVTLRGAQSVRSDDFEQVWFVAADLEGPGLDGDSQIAVWASNHLNGGGSIFSAGSVAEEFSDWGPMPDFDQSNDGWDDAQDCIEQALAGEHSAPEPAATATSEPLPTEPPPPTATAERAGCDPSYPRICIPPPPPDLNCPDVSFRNFTVVPPDPHGFDGNSDGVGCVE